MSKHNRGQGFTLEAILAGALIIASVVFLLLSFPTGFDSSNRDQVNENSQLAESFIQSAHNSGELKPILLNWGTQGGSYECWNGAEEGADVSSSDECYYTSMSGDYSDASEGTGVPSQFGRDLQMIFKQQDMSVNIDIYYQGGSSTHQNLLYMGEPAPTSSTATTQVVFFDDDMIHNLDGSGNLYKTGTNLSEADNIYSTSGGSMQDISPDTNLYNVVTVRVTVWET